MAYADHTSVSALRSRNEIEETLCRYHATDFTYRMGRDVVTILFVMEGRVVKLSIHTPDAAGRTVTKYRRTREMNPAEQQQWCDQETRRRWRSLALVVKAKLEAVASGIAMFDDEFLAYTVAKKNGETIGDILRPQLAEFISGARLPMLTA